MKYDAGLEELQLKRDLELYGKCYYTVDEQGCKHRISPEKLIIRSIKKKSSWIYYYSLGVLTASITSAVLQSIIKHFQ